MIRLLLVDDQDIFRQGLAALLSVEADLEVVGQAKNGQEAILLTQTLQPDVILMDVRMPVCDGVVATQNVHQRYPWIRILVLTTFDDDQYIAQSLLAGALGYLLKRTPSQQIAASIRSVYQGYSQLGPTIAPKVFAQLKSPSLLGHACNNLISQRELEVLRLLGQGKNNQEIAQELYLGKGTVKNYISQILSKLNLRDRVKAALWAQEHLL
ncbi:MAG: response regulator transcription factor [Aphanocapsa sp. GSE-SYN-MK-11-07L]|jgi:DNA-binding NarL/FixJ family response regulator|nr:response regulator transcription factor [Aphanocapsa sp. GSE-SYN-MK-11-07L]